MLARIETTEEKGGMRIKGMQRQLGFSPLTFLRSGGGGGTVRGFLWDACEKRGGGKEFSFRRVITTRAASDEQANLPASPFSGGAAIVAARLPEYFSSSAERSLPPPPDGLFKWGLM